MNSMKCMIVIGLLFLWGIPVLATEKPENILATLKCETFAETVTKKQLSLTNKIGPIETGPIEKATYDYVERFAKTIDVKGIHMTPLEEELQIIYGSNATPLLLKKVLIHCIRKPDHLFKQAVHITTSNMR